jgi:microcystin-dependent protein
MSEPFLAEIKMMSFNFPPKGWAFCNGQFLPINQNQALFSLLGTTYGGNGQTNFALPDLRGRVPIHFGAGVILGQRAGAEAHTVTQSEMPAHTHFVQASGNDALSVVPGGNVLARTTAANLYRDTATSLTTITPASISAVGGSQAHTNMQPYLVLNFCIALQGIFPSQT